jgi:cytochrome c
MMRAMILASLLCSVGIVATSFRVAAEMRGHGGPVKAIAISPDGKTAVTGGFDTSVILWDLERETAKQVLRIHEGPIVIVRFIGDDILSESEAKTVLWTPGQDVPRSVTIPRPVPNGAIAMLTIKDTVVASFPDGRLHWIGQGKTARLPSTANILATVPDGEIVAGGADGTVYILKPDGSIRLGVEVQELPITSLAVSNDGRLIAAAGLRGSVKIIARETGKEVSSLIGPGLPVWSLAFHPDGKMILTGGADRMVRKWDIASGQPLVPANAPRTDFPASVMNERGAQVFRACDACHTVTLDGGNRAGPTLHGVFGRKIGTAKDYVYSGDFKTHDIIWNAQTLSRLFREGPAKVTPGTKMPEQTISNTEDLKTLIDWLEKVTKP